MQRIKRLPSVEIDTNEYVLLMSEDEKLYFIPFQNARWDSTEISLELLPESPEETAFLRTLRRHINEAFARDVHIALALREDAARVKPQGNCRNYIRFSKRLESGF